MNENLDNIIKACQKEHPEAQKELYDRYKGLLFGICRRYVKNTEDAEDVFIGAFYKILTKIKDFRNKGSFEGWMKRIMVNESLMFLRKNNNFNLSIEASNVDPGEVARIESDLQYEDLIKMVEELPPGYRTVFNLYVIEGYKHREIAEYLGISIHTSKSQLILAKKKLKEILKKKTYNKVSPYGKYRFQ